MNYRKEKLRRHWMDRPPLPPSPVPCTGVMGGPFEGWTYEAFKTGAQRRMRYCDGLPTAERWKVYETGDLPEWPL